MSKALRIVGGAAQAAAFNIVQKKFIQDNLPPHMNTDDARDAMERLYAVLKKRVPHFEMGVQMAHANIKTQVEAPMQSGKTSLIIAYCVVLILLRRVVPIVVVRNLSDDLTQFTQRWEELVEELNSDPEFMELRDILNLFISSSVVSAQTTAQGAIAGSLHSACMPIVAMANWFQLMKISHAMKERGRNLRYAMIVDEADMFIPILRGENVSCSDRKKTDRALFPLLQNCWSKIRVSATQLYSAALRDGDANHFLQIKPHGFTLHGHPYRDWRQVSLACLPNIGKNSWPDNRTYEPEMDRDAWTEILTKPSKGRNAETGEIKNYAGFLDDEARVMLAHVGPLKKNHETLKNWLLDNFGQDGLYVIIHNDRESRIYMRDARKGIVEVQMPPMRRGGNRTSPRNIGEVMTWLYEYTEVLQHERGGPKVSKIPSLRNLIIIAGQKAGRGTSYSSVASELVGNLYLTDYVNATNATNVKGELDWDWDRVVQGFGRLVGRKPLNLPLVLWATKEVLEGFVLMNMARDDFAEQVKALALKENPDAVVWEDETGTLFAFKPSTHIDSPIIFKGGMPYTASSAVMKRVQEHLSFFSMNGGKKKEKILDEAQMLHLVDAFGISVKDIVLEVGTTDFGKPRQPGTISTRMKKLFVDIGARRVPSKEPVAGRNGTHSLAQCVDWALKTRRHENYGRATGESLYHDMIREMTMAFREAAMERYRATGKQIFLTAAEHMFHEVDEKGNVVHKDALLVPSPTRVIHESFSRTGVREKDKNKETGPYKFRYCAHRDITKMRMAALVQPNGKTDEFMHRLNYMGMDMFGALLIKEGVTPYLVEDSIKEVNPADDFRLFVGINLMPDHDVRYYISGHGGDESKMPIQPFNRSFAEAVAEAKRLAKENNLTVQVRHGFEPNYVCATAAGQYKYHKDAEAQAVEFENENEFNPEEALVMMSAKR